MGVSARALATITALAGLIALSACSADEKPKWSDSGSAGGPSASASAAQPTATLTAPADGATNVSTATELALRRRPARTRRSR